MQSPKNEKKTSKPGQAIAAENPHPAFSAGEDLERKARCRSRMFASEEKGTAACPQIAFSCLCFSFYLITIFVTTIP
ncbi:MAG: hypothetical protein WBP43_08930 [Chitinophagales bacterium]